ncbi:MAG: DUF1674 domain-containing protein [Steroidobacteraceae bacterium]
MNGVRGLLCQPPARSDRVRAHFVLPAWLSTLVFWQTLLVTVENEDQPERLPTPPASSQPQPARIPPREVGGREGPEPTRYGDWEVRGRCIDF